MVKQLIAWIKRMAIWLVKLSFFGLACLFDILAILLEISYFLPFETRKLVICMFAATGVIFLAVLYFSFVTVGIPENIFRKMTHILVVVSTVLWLLCEVVFSIQEYQLGLERGTDLYMDYLILTFLPLESDTFLWFAERIRPRKS